MDIEEVKKILQRPIMGRSQPDTVSRMFLIGVDEIDDLALQICKPAEEPKLDESRLVTREARTIWDKELLTFFKADVIDPEFELDTYGLAVAKAQDAKTEAHWKEAVEIATEQGYEAGIEEGERRERERTDNLWLTFVSHLPQAGKDYTLSLQNAECFRQALEDK